MATTSKSAQDFVPIKEVRESVIVLSDNSLRAVLMTSSLNFALKGEDEQAAIISQFQDFLNSLDFSVQIFVQSRKMDIKPYLQLLEERYRAQESDLMKIQTREYIEFIKTFVAGTDIMSKTFFVVVPFTPGVAIAQNPIETVTGFLKKEPATQTKKAHDDFEQNKIQLQQRIAVVEQGLVRCGLRTARLGSEEMIELFYKLFNPGEAKLVMPQER